MSIKPNYNSKYRPEIDGLRCIAIFAVVMYHFNFFWGMGVNPFKGGYIGVDVFFVISGYVITQSINNSLLSNNFSLSSFYIKRINRLFPAIIFTLITVYLFGYFFLYEEEFKFLSENAIYSMFFIQNINLSDGSGYFSQEVEINILVHFWSLSVEEQFYLLFPILMIIIHKFIPSKSHSLALIFFLVFIGFIYSSWMSNINPTNNFYLIQSRAFQLLFGCLVFQIRSMYENKIIDNLAASILSCLGLCLIAAYIFLGSSKSEGPNFYSIAPVLGISLTLLTVSSDNIIGKILCYKPLSLLGLISFEVYLLHYPIISGLEIFFGKENNIPNSIKIYALIICLLISYFVHFALTNKVRYSQNQSKSWIYCVIIYFSVLILFSLTLYGNGKVSGSFADKKSEISSILEGALWRYHNNDICLDKYDSRSYLGYGWFFCFLKENKDPQVLILGDSYANQWYPMISQSSAFQDLNVLSYGNVNVKNYFYNKHLKNSSETRTKIIYDSGETLKKEILPLESIKFVIIALASFDSDDKNAILKIRELVSGEIILILPHAMPLQNEFNTANCYPRPFNITPKKCSMLISEIKTVFSDKKKLEVEEFAQNFIDISVFDPNVAYCDSELCDFYKEGAPIFRDVYQHISTHGNNLVLPFWEKKFK